VLLYASSKCSVIFSIHVQNLARPAFLYEIGGEANIKNKNRISIHYSTVHDKCDQFPLYLKYTYSTLGYKTKKKLI
jgi:hypothetical protein